MATPVFACGAECGLTAHWDIVGGSPEVVTSGQRSGLRAFRFVRVADTGTNQIMTKASFGSNGIIVVSAAVYFNVVPSGGCGILGAWIGGTHCGLKYTTLNPAGIRCVASTDTGGASGPITTGRWHQFELVIDTSANPWTVNGRVDGKTLGESSIANAADLAGKPLIAGLITAGPSITGEVIIDDIVASTTLADYPLPAGFIEALVPASDGTHNIAGTGDFQRGNTAVDILNTTLNASPLIKKVPLPEGTVDEASNWRAVAPPNATDYPEAIFGPLSGTPSGIPLSVEAICAYHQIATGAGSFEVLLNDNGATAVVVSASGAAGVVTYRYGRAHFATAPTGGAWTATAGAGNINNVRVRFRSADANPDQCLDAIMLEIYFPDPTGKLSINSKVPGRPAPFKPGEVVRVKH